MPSTHDVTTSPISSPSVTGRIAGGPGETYRFARRENGEALEIEMTLPPGFATGGERHPHQDEHVRVVDGQFAVELDGERHVLRAGEQIAVPRGTAHRPSNPGDRPVRVVVTLTPALRAQEFFETYAGLAREGRSNASGVPRNPLQAAVWLHKFRREVQLTGSAGVAQKFVFPAVAALGHALGFQAHPARFAAPH